MNDDSKTPSSAQIGTSLILVLLATIVGAVPGAFLGSEVAESFDWQENGDAVLASFGAWLGILAGITIAVKATSGAIGDFVSAISRIALCVITCMLAFGVVGHLVGGKEVSGTMGGIGLGLGFVLSYVGGFWKKFATAKENSSVSPSDSP